MPDAHEVLLSRRTLLHSAAAGALVLGLAACGSSDDPEKVDEGASSGGGTSGSGGGPATPSGAVRVGMEGLKFVPASVTVKVGQEVFWVNDETIQHNVVANSGADFQSDIFGRNKTFAFTPKKAGTIEYTCTLHPGMDGTIVVQ